jgi:hypothetical protein
LVPVLLKNIGVKESSGSPPPPRLVISKTMMRNQAHVVFMTESIKDQPAVLWSVVWLFSFFFENHGYVPELGLWFFWKDGYESYEFRLITIRVCSLSVMRVSTRIQVLELNVLDLDSRT